MEEKQKSTITLLTIILGVASWYSLTGKLANSESMSKPVAEKYPLSAEIRVVETDLPYRKESRDGKLEKIVHVKDIDFSKNFTIKTERYNLIKEDDWLPSRFIGHLVSLPRRFIFWDWQVSQGCDEKRTRAALAMLEQKTELRNITVRLNHNEALYDMCKMFTDEKLIKRNPFLARATLGIISSVKDELLAELLRGDYYNPLTQTAVVYSNIESVGAHEMGHHQDFQSYKSDWAYTLSRILPPVMLYQEWKASTYARSIMSKDDDWQFKRYLIPAFGTYCLAVLGMLKRAFSREENEDS
jgi:hypothetical protein